MLLYIKRGEVYINLYYYGGVTYRGPLVCVCVSNTVVAHSLLNMFSPMYIIHLISLYVHIYIHVYYHRHHKMQHIWLGMQLSKPIFQSQFQH